MSIKSIVTSIPQRLGRITEHGNYRPEIDGLRFLAIGTVIPWHIVETVLRAQQRIAPISHHEHIFAYLFPEAVIGVVLFFAISGFVISQQFFRRHQRGQTVNLKHFFLRRLTRIEPPYLLILFVAYLLVIGTTYRPENMKAFWRGPQSFTESLIASIFYVHSAIYNARPRLFPGGWSLEIEVSFYLIAPFLILLYLKIRSDLARVGFGTIVLIATTLFSAFLDWKFGPNGGHRYTILRYFPYLWLGIILADIDFKKMFALAMPAVWDVIGCLGFGLFLISAILQHGAFGFMLLALDAVRLFAISGLILGATRGNSLRRWLSGTWMTILGGACYSLYLTHWQLVKVVTPLLVHVTKPANFYEALALSFAIEIPLILLLGMAFYIVVERTFMRPDWPSQFASALGLKRRAPAGDQSPRDRTS